MRGGAQVHALATQVSPAGQACPQPLQFFSSVLGSTQAPSHTSAVDGQPQAPFVQVSTPGHACPHVPQSSLLVARLAQASPQSTRGDTQAHEPPTHDCPVGQAWPHPPQFFSLVCGSTHVPSHTRSFAGHATHAPFVQISDESH